MISSGSSKGSHITELDGDLYHSRSIIPFVLVLTPVVHEGRFSCLFPHLEALNLRWHKRKTLSYIAEMVEMRCTLTGSLHGIMQLKCITCTQMRGTDPTPRFTIFCQKDQLRLVKFQERGVTVTFFDSSGYIHSM
jgi:hypothetical protein